MLTSDGWSKSVTITVVLIQWRHQRSKGAWSFRGQNILEPGHRVHFFLKKLMTRFLVVALKTQRPPVLLRLFHCQNEQIKRSAVRYGKIFIFCSHYYQSKAIARAVDLPARSFDLACPGVAPPLSTCRCVERWYQTRSFWGDTVVLTDYVITIVIISGHYYVALWSFLPWWS